MWKFLIALILFGHGIGHITGLLAAFTKAGGFSDRPWIFSPRIHLQSGIGRIFGILWLVAMLSLAASGIGVILGQGWWVIMAVGGSIISLVVILPFWNTVVLGAKVGAALDILTLVVLLSPLVQRILALIK